MTGEYRQAYVAGIPTSIKDGGYTLKRCRLEGVNVRSYCPECGEAVVLHLGGSGYLSHPAINEPLEADFYHDECAVAESGDCEWTALIVLRVSVEAVLRKGGE